MLKISYLGRVGRTWSSSPFVRNVATVGSGIVMVQAITLASAPLLTRLYGPEAYGLSAAFAALLNILSPLATFGFASAIVMADTEIEASAVARLTMLCGTAVSFVILVAVYFGQKPIAELVGLAKFPGLLYLVPISLLVSVTLAIANQAAIRQGLYTAKARAQVISTLATNLGKLSGGIFAPSGFMLIVLSLVGQLLNTVLQLFFVPRRGAMLVKNWIGFGGALGVARKYQDFAFFRMPQSVLRAATMGAPVLILTSLFGSATSGQYAIAMTAIGLPIRLLGDAFGDVFYPKITRAIGEKSLSAYSLLARATRLMALFSILAFGGVALWGPWLFALVFGPSWHVAGSYAQLLSPWFAATLIGRASVAAMPALHLQKFLLVREIIFTISGVGALYVGFILFKSDMVAVGLFSAVGVLAASSSAIAAHSRLAAYTHEWNANIRTDSAGVGGT